MTEEENIYIYIYRHIDTYRIVVGNAVIHGVRISDRSIPKPSDDIPMCQASESSESIVTYAHRLVYFLHVRIKWGGLRR